MNIIFDCPNCGSKLIKCGVNEFKDTNIGIKALSFSWRFYCSCCKWYSREFDDIEPIHINAGLVGLAERKEK